ncbi:MAG TPA: 6-phosphogluconolactonase [Pyrinomonadaceae bacterium]|nr:6-phosphogluconolactonase [Pyrinomonadaceae bacterium]
MSTALSKSLTRRVIGVNVWLATNNSASQAEAHALEYEVMESEDAVGQAQFEEIERAAAAKDGDLVIILLGGRGAQALYRLLGELAKTNEIDSLLGRLHVFTQDALAPMRMDNGFSFVRDFERLLGSAFFEKVKSFTPMQTDTKDLEAGLERYLEQLESLGGIDIFFLGLGPEAGAASHLAYIKPGSGAAASDLAGVIPISSSILEHHIKKFKVGGSTVTAADEAECRSATHILTLGPAAILRARRIVQSIVDASTAPGKPESYRRVLEADIATNAAERAVQLDENPGLWLRLHGNIRSLILADVLQN